MLIFKENVLFESTVKVPTIAINDISLNVVNSQWIKSQQFISQLANPLSLAPRVIFNGTVTAKSFVTFEETVTFDKNVVVRGAITAEGDLIFTGSDVAFSNKFIRLNNAETSTGIVNQGSAGIEIARGLLENVRWIFDEPDNRWKGHYADSISSIMGIQASDIAIMDESTIISQGLQGLNKTFKFINPSGNFEVGTYNNVTNFITSTQTYLFDKPIYATTRVHISGTDTFLENGKLYMKAAGNTQIELISTDGGKPQIDFSAQSGVDYNARVYLKNLGLLSIAGTDLQVETGKIHFNENLNVFQFDQGAYKTTFDNIYNEVKYDPIYGGMHFNTNAQFFEFNAPIKNLHVDSINADSLTLDDLHVLGDSLLDGNLEVGLAAVFNSGVNVKGDITLNDTSLTGIQRLEGTNNIRVEMSKDDNYLYVFNKTNGYKPGLSIDHVKVNNLVPLLANHLTSKDYVDGHNWLAADIVDLNDAISLYVGNNLITDTNTLSWVYGNGSLQGNVVTSNSTSMELVSDLFGIHGNVIVADTTTIDMVSGANGISANIKYDANDFIINAAGMSLNAARLVSIIESQTSTTLQTLYIPDNKSIVFLSADGGNDTGYIKHIENPIDQSEFRFSISDSQTGDLFHFGYDDTIYTQQFVPVFTINTNGDTTVTGNLFVEKDMYITGTVTYINTTDMNVTDNLIVINTNEIGDGISHTSYQAGFEVERGTLANVKWVFDDMDDRWKGLDVTNNLLNIKVAYPSDVDDAASLQFVVDKVFELENKVVDDYVKYTEDFSDLNILNKVKVVDGTGSGLDSDMVDGRHVDDVSAATTNTLWTSAKINSITSAIQSELTTLSGGVSDLDIFRTVVTNNGSIVAGMLTDRLGIVGSGCMYVTGSNITKNATIALQYDNTDFALVNNQLTILTEKIQDIIGGMVSSNAEGGISVIYDDINGKLNFQTNNPIITLNGDLSGSATITNLGNITLTASVVNDSHTHDTRYYTETEIANHNKVDVTLVSDIIAASALNSGYRMSADAFHTNGLGSGQMFIEGQYIDSNGAITIGKGIAGGQTAQATLFNANTSIGTTGDIYEKGISLESKYIQSGGTVSNADTVDGLHASSFIRSNADDTVSGNTTWGDNNKVSVGAGADLQFYHDGINSWINNLQGNTYIKNNSRANGIFLQGTGSDGILKNMVLAYPDAYVRLYYAGVEKLRTNSTGISVYGTMTGTATTATYADLGEKYETDKRYEIGTILMIGTDTEATLADGSMPTLGIISEKPAFGMNNTDEMKNHPFVALKGRVPCKIVGPSKRGQVVILHPERPGFGLAINRNFVQPEHEVLGYVITGGLDICEVFVK